MNVSCSNVGTHPMQRFVEMIHGEEEKSLLFNIIKNDIVNLAHHPKGNFVLLSTIQIVKGPMLDYITEHLIGNTLIVHKHIYNRSYPKACS